MKVKDRQDECIKKNTIMQYRFDYFLHSSAENRHFSAVYSFHKKDFFTTISKNYVVIATKFAQKTWLR